MSGNFPYELMFWFSEDCLWQDKLVTLVDKACFWFAATCSPENGDTSDETAFAWSIMFVSESDRLCLTVQVDAQSGALESG